jgi:hypothetical protein
MAIYKPRRSRWPLIAGLTVLAFMVGFAVGAVVVGNRPPDLPAAATSIADGLQGSAQLLEVTQIEYEEAIKPGASEAEFQGALENLARARARYEAVAPALAAIDDARVTAVNQGFDELRNLMERRTPIDEVTPAIDDLEQRLLGD